MEILQPSEPPASIPAVSRGRIERLDGFTSDYISSRVIDVWLPEADDPDRRYPVLYMHDGQMLFDESITWNRQSWAVAETIDALISAGEIRSCLVVGIWNSALARHSEYFPQKPFERLPADFQDSLLQRAKYGNEAFFRDGLQSDNYLMFITRELKPSIDLKYPTRPDRGNTYLAGSSMGGLISIYALCEYPEVFGGAACLSTHWTGIFTNENNPIPEVLLEYLRENLPNPAAHRIYFDYGTETLDALYEPHQRRVDEIMRSMGYDPSNWQTLKFSGEDHSETAWRKRFHHPVKFLLHA